MEITQDDLQDVEGVFRNLDELACCHREEIEDWLLAVKARANELEVALLIVCASSFLYMEQVDGEDGDGELRVLRTWRAC